jgi:hypothetical protein
MTEVINCLGLVSDASVLKPYLKNGLAIANLANSSQTFYLSDGRVSLQGNNHSNSLPWLGLLDHDVVKTIDLKGFNYECLSRLPKNINAVHFYDYADLKRVDEWLHDESLPSSDLVLDYKGGYSEYIPVFDKKVTRAVRHFVVPLNQDIEQFCVLNPHIKTIGFDFDHQRDRKVLESQPVNFVVWSSHPHNHKMGKTQYPHHNHRLHY